jgi:hypothetical protein
MSTEISLTKLSPRDKSCPACNNEGEEFASKSVISPWVLELAQISNPIFPEYKTCSVCGSAWFSVTYSKEILDGLYKGYRGSEYFRIRNSWEPTYTRELNSSLNNGEKWLDGRRRQITKALEESGLRPDLMQSVLDFGGGHGGVMPKFPNRYLLEANEAVIPEPGVELVRSLDSANHIPLDLVMCCGVLEHLNNPTELVTTVMNLKSDTFLFEVPTGTPMHRVGLSRRSTFLMLVASKKIFWRNIQKIERLSGRKWRKYFPLRCSEHLQFFSSQGLKVLLERSGLEVLLLKETRPNESLANEKNLGFEVGLIAVCKKSTTQTV